MLCSALGKLLVFIIVACLYRFISYSYMIKVKVLKILNSDQYVYMQFYIQVYKLDGSYRRYWIAQGGREEINVGTW